MKKRRRVMQVKTLVISRKVDLGIALCHFEIAAQESGLEGQVIQKDPGLSIAEDMDYIATYQLEVK